MNENENLVAEAAENTEQTAEQTPKTYTEDEFNAKLDEVLAKKIARKEAKIRKEYDSKYGELEDVLKAGMGKQDMGEITRDLRKFCEGKKISIPKRDYSAKETEVLARHDAEEIIAAGFEEVVEETDRLAKIGVDRMTAKDKAVFRVLAEHRKNTEQANEYAKMGVGKDVYESPEFKEFASNFNSNVPASKIYDYYQKTQPKKEIKPMGSVKGAGQTDSGVKEFYSYEEAKKFTRADYAKNPALLKAVEASAKKW